MTVIKVAHCRLPAIASLGSRFSWARRMDYENEEEEEEKLWDAGLVITRVKCYILYLYECTRRVIFAIRRERLS